MINVVQLNEKNIPDAEDVIRECFGDDAIRIFRHVLRNPIKQSSAPLGHIAYEEGRPVAFEAMMVRKLWVGTDVQYGSVSGLSCVRSDASVESFVDVRIAQRKSRFGIIGYGNTMCKETYNIARKNKNSVIGPKSCSRYLIGYINILGCLLYAFRRKVLRCRLPMSALPAILNNEKRYVAKVADLKVERLREFSPEVFDTLMADYLKSNRGLVSSRTAAELDWVYGERIRSSDSVLLLAKRNSRPVGYIIVQIDPIRLRGTVVDWFAVKNDRADLSHILGAAITFLKKCTKVLVVEAIGFPEYVQPIIEKHLKRKLPLGHNQFSWTGDKSHRAMLEAELSSEDSWFFGPYDGDACL